MEHLDSIKIEPGVLLIASPQIEGGIFHRSVVLLCDHTPTGFFGLIINKSLSTKLQQDLCGIQKEYVRIGGPHQPSKALFIRGQEGNKDEGLEVCPGIYISSDLESAQVGEKEGQTLLCLGHGAWEAGILEEEVRDGAWFLYPATKGYIFATPPEKIWQTLLYTMGGKCRILSLLPEDLELN